MMDVNLLRDNNPINQFEINLITNSLLQYQHARVQKVLSEGANFFFSNLISFFCLLFS